MGWKIYPKKAGALLFQITADNCRLMGCWYYALLTNPNGPRAPKAMVERFLPSVPFIGNWLSSVGAVIGDPLNCERMLDNEEAVVAVLKE